MDYETPLHDFAITIIKQMLQSNARILSSIEASISDIDVSDTDEYTRGYRDGVLKVTCLLRDSMQASIMEINQND